MRATTLLLICALVVACDPTSPEPAHETGPAIQMDSPFENGSVIEAPALGPTFKHELLLLKTPGARFCEASGPFAPGPGELRLSVEVSLTARSRSSIRVNPLAFSLVDNQGKESATTLAGCEETLQPTTVTEGQTVSGHLAFDVAADARSFQLVYEPFIVGRPALKARVKVPTPQKAK